MRWRSSLLRAVLQNGPQRNVWERRDPEFPDPMTKKKTNSPNKEMLFALRGNLASRVQYKRDWNDICCQGHQHFYLGQQETL